MYSTVQLKLVGGEEDMKGKANSCFPANTLSFFPHGIFTSFYGSHWRNQGN